MNYYHLVIVALAVFFCLGLCYSRTGTLLRIALRRALRPKKKPPPPIPAEDEEEEGVPGTDPYKVA